MMASGTEDSGIAWLTPLFADEGVLREAFAHQPDLMKEVLRNKGFLDTLFDAGSGAFAKLLATPAEGTADVDALIGLVGGDGGSATPRQMTVAGKLEGWLADASKAEQVFRAHPELAQALVDNPAFVERVKVLKPEFFRELLAEGKERFRGDAAMLAEIEKSGRGLAVFTGEGSLRYGQDAAAWELGEPLVEAARSGDEKAIKSMLSQKDVKAFIDHQDGDGRTALMWAAYGGHTEVVKLLLDKGAHVNVQDNDGCTALMWPAYKGYTEITRLLLDKADPNLQDDFGMIALDWAMSSGHAGMANLLRSSMEEKDKRPWTGRENDRRQERDDHERGTGREG
jgi:hypothetical protein